MKNTEQCNILEVLSFVMEDTKTSFIYLSEKAKKKIIFKLKN